MCNKQQYQERSLPLVIVHASCCNQKENRDLLKFFERLFVLLLVWLQLYQYGTVCECVLCVVRCVCGCSSSRLERVSLDVNANLLENGNQQTALIHTTTMHHESTIYPILRSLLVEWHRKIELSSALSLEVPVGSAGKKVKKGKENKMQSEHDETLSLACVLFASLIVVALLLSLIYWCCCLLLTKSWFV